MIRNSDRSDATRRGGVSSLQDALSTFLRSTGLDAHVRHWKIFEAWSKALGGELGARARAVRFQRGELLVEVESAAHLHELRNFTGEGYRRTANEHLEKAGIRDTIRSVAFKLKS